MEQKNDKKGLIVLVIILSACVIALGGFIIFDKVLHKNPSTSVPEDKNKLKVVESTLPQKLNNGFTYWNYQEMYDYYFTMNGDNNAINGIEYYDFVKIENNKLMWKINNAWVTDATITDDIKYFDIKINDLTGDKFILVLTANNELYKVVLGKSEQASDYLDKLSSENYKEFNYQQIKFEKTIDKIQEKSVCECDCWSNYYIESNGKIYVLDTSETIKPIEESNIFKESNILYLNSKCVTPAVKVERNSTITNVLDADGNKLKMKEYIAIDTGEEYENNPLIYNLIIDNNNKLYSFTNSSLKDGIGFKYLDTVEDLKYDHEKEKITIKLSNGKILNIGQ